MRFTLLLLPLATILACGNKKAPESAAAPAPAAAPAAPEAPEGSVALPDEDVKPAGAALPSGDAANAPAALPTEEEAEEAKKGALPKSDDE